MTYTAFLPGLQPGRLSPEYPVFAQLVFWLRYIWHAPGSDRESGAEAGESPARQPPGMPLPLPEPRQKQHEITLGLEMRTVDDRAKKGVQSFPTSV